MRDNLADRRQAVDEYLAHLAEKRPQDLTQPERTLWAKIKQWFINLLRQKGFNIKRLTDEDLIDLLRESHRRLLQQEAARRQASPEAPADRTGEPEAPAGPEAPTPPEAPKAEGEAPAEAPYTKDNGDPFVTGYKPSPEVRKARAKADDLTDRQHFHYGGHARPERTELLAQRHTLQDYIDRKEAVFQIQKNKYLGIKTAGLVRLSNIEKRSVLWEKSEPSTTGAAPANVTATQPNEDGRTGGNASNQSTDLSSKVTQKSPTDQTNPQQSATEQGNDVTKVEVLDEQSPNTPSDVGYASKGRIPLAKLLNNIEKTFGKGKKLLSKKNVSENNKNQHYYVPTGETEGMTIEERKGYVKEKIGQKLTREDYSTIKRINPLMGFFRLYDIRKKIFT